MIEFKAKEYCLYGFKYHKDPRAWICDVKKSKTAYTFDENMQPTRDVNKAKVIMLDSGLENGYSYRDSNMEIYLNGYCIYLIQKDKLQWTLDIHPLPRKGIPQTIREDVYEKYDGRCAYCGCELDMKEMQVDHFIAHMEGGEDTLENYMPSCSICNRVKSTLSINKFKDEIRHCGKIHRKRKKPIMADSDKIAIKYGLTENDHEITLYYERN